MCSLSTWQCQFNHLVSLWGRSSRVSSRHLRLEQGLRFWKAWPFVSGDSFFAHWSPVKVRQARGCTGCTVRWIQCVLKVVQETASHCISSERLPGACGKADLRQCSWSFWDLRETEVKMLGLLLFLPGFKVTDHLVLTLSHSVIYLVIYIYFGDRVSQAGAHCLDWAGHWLTVTFLHLSAGLRDVCYHPSCGLHVKLILRQDGSGRLYSRTRGFQVHGQPGYIVWPC